MKKFAYLILLALLFAGCNNMLTNPDAFNSEDATVSMDISQLKARLATDGVVLTSTLDFVGTEPKHAPFEKTQTINGNKIEYTVKGLPTGSTVQFKLSVFKNGILVFEGVSNKVTIKGKNDVVISLDKQSNWITYFNFSNAILYGFDLNFTDSFNDAYKIDLPNICSNCADDKDNVYVLANDDGYKIYRFSPPYKTSVVIGELSSDGSLRYDFGTDTLYCASEYGYYYLTNASTRNSVETISGEPNLYPEGYEYPFTIYNNNFYWIEKDSDSNSVTIVCPENDVSCDLYKYEDGEFSGKIYDLIKSSFEGNKFKVEISALVATKEGVFALLTDRNRPDFGETYYGASRGGVIKMDHNLTTATLYGWTDSKRVITVTNKSNPDDVYVSKEYMPKNIKEGFYGPAQILAVKPKKLIFTDVGGWIYIDEAGNVQQKITESHHFIIFDLESCTYNSVSTSFPGNIYSEFFSEYNSGFSNENYNIQVSE